MLPCEFVILIVIVLCCLNLYLLIFAWWFVIVVAFCVCWFAWGWLMFSLEFSLVWVFELFGWLKLCCLICIVFMGFNCYLVLFGLFMLLDLFIGCF